MSRFEIVARSPSPFQLKPNSSSLCPLCLRGKKSWTRSLDELLK
ncbi:hypothetical protein CKA32_002248 [Geitlerinema sp. FC II]|nr:hypothetical protein CKA32_002248 [Geitlerinema sp. FC II]